MRSLRKYQREATDSLYSYWRAGNRGNPLIVAPTASGKSLIIATFLREVFEIDPHAHVVVLAHRKELLDQNLKELLSLWPEAPAGIYSAGLKRKENRPIVFAGIQSIYRQAGLFDPFDLMIIDEAHLIPRKSDTQYGRFLREARERNPRAKVVGLTATPFRLDSGYLHKGRGALFDAIAYDIPISTLIKDGYLSPITTRHSRLQIDLRDVRVRAGEYVESDIDREAMRIASGIVDEICRAGQDRKGWMVFTAGVKSAEFFAQALRQRGVAVRVVTGESADREETLSLFRAQKLRCLVSVAVLTTGFNATHVDLIAMVRATKSPGLYVQICGRGMRTHPNKRDCLFLDYGSNVLRHGFLDSVHIAAGGGTREGEAPLKVCDSCHELVALGARECPECGFVFLPEACPRCDFPFGIDRICYRCTKPKAYAGEMLAGNPMTLRVQSIQIARHKKKGKPDSVKISYRAGMRHFYEWVCPEHDGFAFARYRTWCKRAGIWPPPRTVSDFLEAEIPVPYSITVIPKGKYFDILNIRHQQKEENRCLGS